MFTAFPSRDFIRGPKIEGNFKCNANLTRATAPYRFRKSCMGEQNRQ
jgi:hypothetical protein